MSVEHDPPRWLSDPELASALRSELQAAVSDAPGLERRARMMSVMERELGLPTPPAAAAPRVSTGLKRLKLVLGSAALMGALGLLLVWAARPASLPARAPESAPRPPVPAPLVVQPDTQLELPELPRNAITKEEPVVPTLPLPPPVVRRRARIASAPPPPVELLPEAQPEPVSARADVVAELELLARARRALLTSPAHALEFTEQHARDFPHGTFGEEREVLAIQSLYRLGLVDEAKRRTLGFEQQFPGSAHRAHLTRMMSDPAR